jgi:hypothetical protein
MIAKRFIGFGVTLALLALIVAPASALAAPPWWPVVSGTVYGTDGLAIPGATIQVSELFKGVFRPVATLTTDANGQWSYTNKDNTYRFEFSAPSADPQSHELVMARNGTYALDVTLQSYGVIAGTITDGASAAGLSGALVEIFKRDVGGTWPTTPVVTTTAGPDGSYSSGTLATGEYAVRASAEGYASAYFGGATIELATPVTVLRAVTATASFSLEAEQTEGVGAISGIVVSGASRVPMSGAYVWLYMQKPDGSWPATSPGWGTPDVSLRTASDGTWSSGPIPLGNYRVRFFTTHTGSQWWQYVTSFDQATTLTLSYDGQAITGIEGWFYMP